MIKIEDYGFPKRSAINWKNLLTDAKRRDEYRPLVIVLLEEMGLVFEYLEYLKEEEYVADTQMRKDVLSFFKKITPLLKDLNLFVESRQDSKDKSSLFLASNEDVSNMVHSRYGSKHAIPDFPELQGRRGFRNRNPERDQERREQPFYTFLRGLLFLLKETDRIDLLLKKAVK